jgi:pimeloyl-ACP methyl ester carboxylesterase
MVTFLKGSGCCGRKNLVNNIEWNYPVMPGFLIIMPKFIAVRMARKASPTYPDDEIIPWVNSKKILSSDFLKSFTSMGMDNADPFEVFKKITVPVLLFIGDKEKMLIVSMESAQKAANLNNKVRVIHLEGASHDICRTRCDGYMPALKKFLQDIYHS